MLRLGPSDGASGEAAAVPTVAVASPAISPTDRHRLGPIEVEIACTPRRPSDVDGEPRALARFGPHRETVLIRMPTEYPLPGCV